MMKMRTKTVLIGSLLVLTLLACQNKNRRKEILFDFETTTENEQNEQTRSDFVLGTDLDATIEVPYKEQDGVKIIPVKINNGFEIDMVFDTGCSSSLISLAEAKYLAEKGLLAVEDIKGVSHSMIADGSIVENAVINLKEIIIGDKIVCYNVEAVVSENADAPLLLGNEVLNRTLSYTIDNQKRVIRFQLKDNHE